MYVIICKSKITGNTIDGFSEYLADAKFLCKKVYEQNITENTYHIRKLNLDKINLEELLTQEPEETFTDVANDILASFKPEWVWK